MKAFVFDMDGLMFDTERVFMEAWDYVGEQMGLGKTGHMVLKTLGCNTEECNRLWREDYPGVDTDEIWRLSREFMEDYYSKYTVTVKKGLFELLTYLRRKKYPIAVCSSTSRRKVEKHLVDAHVRQYFDVVVGGDMVAASKPAPDIYLHTCKLLGEKPVDCYALEDSRNGLLSAHKAGCTPIMVPDLWQPDDTVKDFILGPFESLLDVRDWLISRQ